MFTIFPLELGQNLPREVESLGEKMSEKRRQCWSWGGARAHPNRLRASRSSLTSMVPERSRSKCINTFCQSLMYFQRPANCVIGDVSLWVSMWVTKGLDVPR